MIRDMLEDGPLGWFMLLLLATIIFGTPVFVWAVIEESNQWVAFKINHDCKIVGKMSGDTFTTVGPNIGGGGGIAIGVGSTPGKTGWLCDDGVTYWR